MVDRVVGRFQPSRVVIFGSQERGNANEWSDVGLLVLMGSVPDRHRSMVEIRQSLSDLPVSMDIFVATADEISSRGHVVGTELHTALRKGTAAYE